MKIKMKFNQFSERFMTYNFAMILSREIYVNHKSAFCTRSNMINNSWWNEENILQKAPIHYSDVIMSAMASRHRCFDRLLNRLFRRRSKKISNLHRVTDLCVGKSPVTGELIPAQRSSRQQVRGWWERPTAMWCNSLKAVNVWDF